MTWRSLYHFTIFRRSPAARGRRATRAPWRIRRVSITRAERASAYRILSRSEVQEDCLCDLGPVGVPHEEPEPEGARALVAVAPPRQGLQRGRAPERGPGARRCSL